MTDFISCDKCVNGYIYMQQDEKEEEYVKKCQCLKDFQRNKKLEIAYNENNIGSFNKQYNLQTDYKGEDRNKNRYKIYKFVQKFMSTDIIHNYNILYSNLILYFYGTNGTQKTTLSKYICKELINKGLGAYHILANDLIILLHEAQRDESKKNRIDTILDKDFLVIDEFDPPKVCIYGSGYQLSFLTSFLKIRLETKKKSTIFISNSLITDKIFIDKFGKTIQDLIKREIHDTLIFEDNYEMLRNDFNVNDLWG